MIFCLENSDHWYKLSVNKLCNFISFRLWNTFSKNSELSWIFLTGYTVHLGRQSSECKGLCVYVPVIVRPCASRISVIRNAAATSQQHHHPDVLKETPSLCLPNAALPKLIIVFIIVTLFYANIRTPI
jgi:hypothetical protein